MFEGSFYEKYKSAGGSDDGLKSLTNLAEWHEFDRKKFPPFHPMFKIHDQMEYDFHAKVGRMAAYRGAYADDLEATKYLILNIQYGRSIYGNLFFNSDLEMKRFEMLKLRKNIAIKQLFEQGNMSAAAELLERYTTFMQNEPTYNDELLPDKVLLGQIYLNIDQSELAFRHLWESRNMFQNWVDNQRPMVTECLNGIYSNLSKYFKQVGNSILEAEMRYEYFAFLNQLTGDREVEKITWVVTTENIDDEIFAEVQKIKNTFQRADAFFQKGELTGSLEVISILFQYFDKFPNVYFYHQAEALVLFGKIKFKLEGIDKALEVFAEALNLVGDRIGKANRLYFYLSLETSRFLMQEKQMPQAFNFFADYFWERWQKYPKVFEAKYHLYLMQELSEIAFGQSTDLAIAFYLDMRDCASRLKSEALFEEATWRLGFIYNKSGNFDQSEFYRQENVALQKEKNGEKSYEHAMAVNNLATTYLRTGKMESALLLTKYAMDCLNITSEQLTDSTLIQSIIQENEHLRPVLQNYYTVRKIDLWLMLHESMNREDSSRSAEFTEALSQQQLSKFSFKSYGFFDRLAENGHETQIPASLILEFDNASRVLLYVLYILKASQFQEALTYIEYYAAKRKHQLVKLPSFLEYRSKMEFFENIREEFELCLSILANAQREKVNIAQGGVRVIFYELILFINFFKSYYSRTQLRYLKALTDEDAKKKQADIFQRRNQDAEDLIRTLFDKHLNMDERGRRINAGRHGFSDSEKELENLIEYNFHDFNLNFDRLKRELGEGEGVVEIIRVRDFDFQACGWGQSYAYYAFIVRWDEPLPRFELISNNPEELESYGFYSFMRDQLDSDHNFLAPIFLRDIVEQRGLQLQEIEQVGTAFNFFLKPFFSYIENIKKLFFIPDGIYWEINIETISNPTTNSLFREEIEIKIIPSARFITQTRDPQVTTSGMLLVGNPTFGDVGGKNLDNPSVDDSAEDFLTVFLQDFQAHAPKSKLDGTQHEIEAIYQYLSSQPLTTQFKASIDVLTGENASKANFKRLCPHKSIIHIASHGYTAERPYNGSDEILDDLCFSGILLAEANHDFATGYLSAYELSKMDLHNTDLVVLSACDTGKGGLGQFWSGVVGLKSALFSAGVNNVIISLWKVDDEITSLLMVYFYQYLFEEGNQSVKSAFVKAQDKVKIKYAEPYYWAGFIVIEK
ncbi:MAG: CHAT domain-containing protein [Saprospiraceae bacterium]|nr:CHAT domain-containing protein [Saprospiraceae bacterium]